MATKKTKVEITEAEAVDREVTKVDENTFEVSQTITRSVQKDALIEEIGKLEDVIDDIRQRTSLDNLEQDLANKKALLAELK